jgi:hypothetical protein
MICQELKNFVKQLQFVDWSEAIDGKGYSGLGSSQPCTTCDMNSWRQKREVFLNDRNN